MNAATKSLMEQLRTLRENDERRHSEYVDKYAELMLETEAALKKVEQLEAELVASDELCKHKDGELEATWRRVRQAEAELAKVKAELLTR